MEQLLQYTFWTQKTTDFQKSKSISLELGRAKDKHKEKRQRILGQAPATQEGSLEGGKFSAHSETFSQARTRGNFRTSEGNFSYKCVEDKEGRIWQRDQCWLATHNQAVCKSISTKLVLGAEAQALGVGPQGEAWGWLLWRNSEELIWQSWGVPGKILGLPERQEIIVMGTL